MDNELRIRNFIINLEEPFQLAELSVAFRKNGGTNDMLALQMVSTLLDEGELVYQDVTVDEEGYPVKAYLTKKCVAKLNSSKYTK